MHSVVCNIPHAGRVLPVWSRSDMMVSEAELTALAAFMMDKDVDKLWEFVPAQRKTVASVSRIVVDTERFLNDEDEPMAQKGMGMFYTHTPDGKPFRRRSERAYQRAVACYTAYHRELEEKVDRCLSDCGRCLILDCHSFHDEMRYTPFSPATFPDVCIGINGALFPEAETVIRAFREGGYSVKINEPFEGSIVPLKHLENPRVLSLMIELNRRIYDNPHFPSVQALCNALYHQLG